MLLNQAFADSGKAEEHKRFNVFADVTYNSSTIKTKDSETTDAASSSVSFSAIELGADYFISSKLAVTAQMLFKIQSSLDADVRGFDAGARYYPLQKGHKSQHDLLGSKIETSPGPSPFVYVGFSNREFQFSSVNISFSGVQVGGGIDFHLSQRTFLRGTLNYQMLQNTSSRTSNGLDAGIGYGYSF